MQIYKYIPLSLYLNLQCIYNNNNNNDSPYDSAV